MTIHVDELVSEVSMEPEAAPGPAASPAAEETAVRLREGLRRLRDDAWRTAAEGYDD